MLKAILYTAVFWGLAVLGMFMNMRPAMNLLCFGSLFFCVVVIVAAKNETPLYEKPSNKVHLVSGIVLMLVCVATDHLLTGVAWAVTCSMLFWTRAAKEKENDKEEGPEGEAE